MPIFERVSPDLPVTIKTTTYFVVDNDNGTEIQFESASALAANLPDVSTVQNGFNVIVRNVGDGELTIEPYGEETIDGETSLALDAGDWRWIRNDGTEWKSISSSSMADQDITLTGDVTGEGVGTITTTIANDAVTTAKIADNAVTFAKLQNISTDRLIGRDAAGTGDPEEISAGGGIEFTGSGSIQRSALTGDVSASAGSNSTTIANNAVTTSKINDNAVTYAKIQDFSASSKLLGSSSTTSDPTEITLGSGLSMSGTTLSALASGSGSVKQIQFATQNYEATVSSGGTDIMASVPITVSSGNNVMILGFIGTSRVATVGTTSWGVIKILRDSTVVETVSIEFLRSFAAATGWIPFSCVVKDTNPGAGTYTYKVQVGVSGTGGQIIFADTSATSGIVVAEIVP